MNVLFIVFFFYFCRIIISSTICQFTYKENNILDLVFCKSDLIDSIAICDTFISDHCLLTFNTLIPVCFTNYYNIVNPPSSIFEILKFKRCNWLSLQTTAALFFTCFNEDYFNVFMEKLRRYAPNWTKLRKSLLRSHSQSNLNKPLAIEEKIITSHIIKLFHEDAIAVAKIKEDPNFFIYIYLDFSKAFDNVDHEVVSFANDTQLYSNISYVEYCDSLHSDLNCVYDTNNMLCNSKNVCRVCV